jgi:phage host-nuclease inhibitor protein Gam
MGVFDLFGLKPAKEDVERLTSSSDFTLKGDESLSELAEMYVSAYVKVGEYQQLLNEEQAKIFNEYSEKSTSHLAFLSLLKQRIETLAKMQRGHLLSDEQQGKSVQFGALIISFRKSAGALSLQKPWDDATACDWLRDSGYADCVNVIYSLNKNIIKEKYSGFPGSGMFKLSKGSESVNLSIDLPDLKKIAG